MTPFVRITEMPGIQKKHPQRSETLVVICKNMPTKSNKERERERDLKQVVRTLPETIPEVRRAQELMASKTDIRPKQIRRVERPNKTVAENR